MISAVAGEAFVADVFNAPTGLVGTIRVRVVDEDDVAVIGPTTNGIIELVAGSGMYRAYLQAPSVVGDYTILWDTGGDPPALFSEPEALRVVAVDTPTWTPSVQMVAELLRARTNVMGTERGAFDAETRPTYDQVDEIIASAVSDVIAHTGTYIPDAYTAEASRLAALRAAALIEASFFPDHLDTDRSAHRQYTAMYLNGVQALAAAIPRALRLV